MCLYLNPNSFCYAAIYIMNNVIKAFARTTLEKTPLELEN